LLEGIEGRKKIMVSLVKVAHDVVTTDTCAWHSSGITGVHTVPTVGYALRLRDRLMDRLPNHLLGRKGAYIRITPGKVGA
jgi:hypothetical protein